MTFLGYIATLGQLEGLLDTLIQIGIKDNLYLYIRDSQKGGPSEKVIEFLLEKIQDNAIKQKIILINKSMFIRLLLKSFRRLHLFIPRGTYIRFGAIVSTFAKEIHIVPDGAVPTKQLVTNKNRRYIKVMKCNIHIYFTMDFNAKISYRSIQEVSHCMIYPTVQKKLISHFANLSRSKNTLLILGKNIKVKSVEEKLSDAIKKIIERRGDYLEITYLPHPRELKKLNTLRSNVRLINDYTEIISRPELIISCGTSLISLFIECTDTYKIYIDSSLNNLKFGRGKRSNIFADEYIDI